MIYNNKGFTHPFLHIGTFIKCFIESVIEFAQQGFAVGASTPQECALSTQLALFGHEF